MSLLICEMGRAGTWYDPGGGGSSRGLMEFHIDPDSPAHNPAFNQDKTYMFYCASGGRSAWLPRLLWIWVFRRWLILPAALPLGPRLVAQLNRRLG